jgi:uncharacterized protein YdhG (YjbR/CyaY superfamily)
MSRERDDAAKAAKPTARSPRAGKPDGAAEVLAAIATLPEPDRTLAETVHRIVTGTAPELVPRLWYGMPAYAKDGKVVCFFQSAAKFKTRYATFGFQDGALLDDGRMWPVAFALTGVTPAEEERLTDLVRRAVGR